MDYEKGCMLDDEENSKKKKDKSKRMRVEEGESDKKYEVDGLWQVNGLLVSIITAQKPLSILINTPADGSRGHMTQNTRLESLSESSKALTLVDQLEGIDQSVTVSYPHVCSLSTGLK